MSTRSTIARKTPSGFRGVYHHWDGYPTALGKTLFHLRKDVFKGSTTAMLKFLIDEHPGGWSTINDRDFSKAPGFSESSSMKNEPGKGPECYCHGDRHESANPINHRTASSCGCEWAYVFKSKNEMLVLSSRNESGSKMIGMWGFGNPNAEWFEVAKIDLNGDEPNWSKIEG